MLQTTSSHARSTARRWPRRWNQGIALAALGVLSAFGASAAQAKTRTTHPYASVIRTTMLSSANGYPAPGGTAVLTGSWNTSLYGHGALIDHVTMTAPLSPTEFTFKGTEVASVTHGTFRDTFTGTATVIPGLGQLIAIHGRGKGGTGAYRRAVGSFVFEGFTDSGSTVTNGHSRGAISY